MENIYNLLFTLMYGYNLLLPSVWYYLYAKRHNRHRCKVDGKMPKAIFNLQSIVAEILYTECRIIFKKFLFVSFSLKEIIWTFLR